MQLYPSVRNFERSFILQNKGSHYTIFPPDLSALTLHILAMAFMFCDHLWATLAGDAWWLTGIGRLAFPMFAFFLVEGFFHTHDKKKYCMRLLLLAILSELPINLMYSGLLFYPFHQNVIWTLLTGFLCIWAIDTLRKKCPVWLWIPSILLLSAVGYVLATLLMFDYYGEGVLTVIVFYLFHGKKWWQLAGQFAGLYWINVMLLAGMQIPLQLFGHAFEISEQGLALLCLPLLWCYHGRQGAHNRKIQLACYAFYPVHMLVLGILSKLIFS